LQRASTSAADLMKMCFSSLGNFHPEFCGWCLYMSAAELSSATEVSSVLGIKPEIVGVASKEWNLGP